MTTHPRPVTRAPARVRATPVTDDERARIVQAHGDGLSRNEIARYSGRSAGTVTRVLREAGCATDRAATVEATTIQAARRREQRHSLGEDLLDDLPRLQARAWSPWRGRMPDGQGGMVDVELDLPPAGEVLATYAAVHSAVRSHLRLTEDVELPTTDRHRADLTQLLDDLADAVTADRAARTNPTPEPC